MANRKFGNWKDTNNCYVKLIPYWEYFSENFSKSSITAYYLELVKFALWNWRHGRKTIIEADGPDCLKYFKSKINRREVLKSSKKRVYHFISSYYNHLEDYLEVFEKKKFTNPIPHKMVNFNGKKSALEDLEQEFQLISLEEIKRIIKHFYFTRKGMYYIIACLIIYSGPRIREIVQVELKNLALEDRWFITEVKSSHSNKRMGIYYFPDFFVSELKQYIRTLKLKHPDSKYLFPSPKSKSHHISPRTIEFHFYEIKKALGLTALSNPHIFRDFLNSRREELGATNPQRKFLLNQKTGDVNINSYLKKFKNRVELRKLYDKYNYFPESLKPNVRLI